VFNSTEMSKSQRMIESELERTIVNLKAEMVNSEEYKKTLSTVEKLHAMMDKQRSSSVSKDTVLVVVANLVGILLIIKHENVNVITSKALSFVMRPK
jgi:hypothetical protein